MIPVERVTALRMARQGLTESVNAEDYAALFRDLQPGLNVYWNGFGDPPSLTHRAAFNDMEYNRVRQARRELVKGRFGGGNLGWIVPEDWALFAGLYRKPLRQVSARQQEIMHLIQNDGPMNIQVIKERTGLLVKEITPVLHRLQEAFWVYEDQHDGEWDRGWTRFADMWPDVDPEEYTRHQALLRVLPRFAARMVVVDAAMARDFYKLPLKEVAPALHALEQDGILRQLDPAALDGPPTVMGAATPPGHGPWYALHDDAHVLATGDVPPPAPSVWAMHRNDVLVKAHAPALAAAFPHAYPDTLYYLLIDGIFQGAVAGKFRYTPEVEDVLLTLSPSQAAARRADILRAIHDLCGQAPRRYQGEV